MSDNIDLQPLFYPTSVAVVGASTREGSVGNDIVKNLVSHKFIGPIYPVNPKAQTLYNLPCFPDISNIPQNVDLAVVVVPAAIVPEVLERAGARGVKSAIVISAGFKETGSGGQELEKQLKEIAQKHRIALIGPNCLGMINPEINLHACFASIMPRAGSIAFISQSGALCSSVLDYAKGMGIGFSKFISIGNKALIDEVDIIKYLNQDPKTKVIMMYEEQLSDAAYFIETIRDITTRPNGTPVISLKAGRTAVGAAASASHTGALGGDDALIEAVFRKAGVTRAYSIQELFDYAIAFANNTLPKGNRVAIITNAGGPGVITADEAAAAGLTLASLSKQTTAALKTALPSSSNFHNPVDVLGDADAARYAAAIEAVLKDDEVDSAIVILTPQTMTQVEKTAEEIVRLKKTYPKPVVTCFMGMGSVEPGVQILQQGAVATIAFPENAARAISAMTQFALRTQLPFSQVIQPDHINKQEAQKHIEACLAQDITTLGEAAARPILEAYGMSLLKTVLVHSRQEVEEAAKHFTGKVVLKIVSPDIVHKSDVGGVVVDVTPADVGSHYDQMMQTVRSKLPTARLEGAILVEMANKGGFEFIIGGKRDDALKVATIMVGIGGLYVEVIKDVSFSVVPLTRYGAEKVIGRTKAARILEGVRGQPPLDKETLIDSLARISWLLHDFPQIKELDINPLLLFETGAQVLDARIKLAPV